ncbi:hypothetical protein SAICODRAFT_115476 [Saitoella complicata NRRL Y-17804]|uniref:uncharacterized protein n=1 Tax=Saitoella complicata (strain BCRC 22490 / CBS 7301 / JCM 7358 / NBRC 10748 / NRRL Y-17804) TaxID=698492 RepID=UPI000867F029|nr:uncharacterized protein SAICODRAFT_115476 [Saitoella complicata NRRL Y-17804]ODQ53474.1 hypothetical protein SAICODRAFT_115476 [Saitoella complicata NRRL Y-17804]
MIVVLLYHLLLLSLLIRWRTGGVMHRSNTEHTDNDEMTNHESGPISHVQRQIQIDWIEGFILYSAGAVRYRYDWVTPGHADGKCEE